VPFNQNYKESVNFFNSDENSAATKKENSKNEYTKVMYERWHRKNTLLP
jgi:hypothetical protein